ncbi:MAG: ATP-binding protein [Cyanobacteria bacterium J06621_11]
MQQAYLFESVTTERHLIGTSEENRLETTSVQSHPQVSSEQIPTPVAQLKDDQIRNEQLKTEQLRTYFVLMRSPTLNVLLVATPLSEFSESERSETQTRSTQSKEHIALQTHPSASTHAITQETIQPSTRFSTQPSNSKPNLMQAILSQALLPVANAQNELPAYQIQLSFDDQTIDKFIQQHSHRAAQQSQKKSFPQNTSPSPTPGPMKPTIDSHQEPGQRFPTGYYPQGRASSAHISSKQGSSGQGLPKHQPAQEKQTKEKQAKTERHQTNKSANNAKRAELETERNLDNRVVINHEQFVLAWAKQLADSPEGLLQATLANQVQQSLLLNQVITRIRHSLDLPAILETTVAQVREFLSADRLVVYQFEQIKSVDLSSPSSTEPFVTGANKSDTHKSDTHKSDHKPIQNLSADDSPINNSQTDNPPTTDINQHSDTIIGRCTHDGHITYESRISQDIPSVLNLSESECFMPSLPIRDRYIMGHPIAVDDVDQKYAHAACLLNCLHQAQVKSKIIAPIIVQDQLWGLLIAHQCRDYRHWQETEILFLQHIAEHLAVAISQAALCQQLQEQTTSLESCVVERTQNLHDALLAAESANLTKGEFLSTMSHELRTPLTYIIGMSATLLRWSFGELSDRQRSYLDTINHSGEQLLEIINDILEFAKISSGRSFLEISEFSLSELINEVMEHFQSIAERQDVELSLSLRIDQEQDRFVADARRLQQILSNLVHNAIKFTPAGGQVKLNVWREKNGREDNGHENDIGVFQVEDTGIGIPEAQQDLLFEKFKQLESPFQRQYAGTGLGLAMTKRLVELHGGTVQVQSTVDEGSVFSVRLPIQKPVFSKQRYQVPSTLVGSANRVLLIEEQEDSAAIICDLLTADGYEVIWQVNADQIFTQLESLKPGILIADLSLLSHDAAKVKDIQLTIMAMNTKVLALLAQCVSESSHIAHHDTLNKPIDPKKLLEKVRHLTVVR